MLIDDRHNLSPKYSSKHKKERERKSKNEKKERKEKRMFYGDRFCAATKGKLQSAFKVKEKIGSGSFSTVRRGVRRSDKKEIAIKVITKTSLNPTEQRLVRREIGVQQKVGSHPNIVSLLDIFETPHHLYLILEYCKGGELFDELLNCTPNGRGWFSEDEASQMIRQIASGLAFMHSKHIIHRDLKLENILISSKHPKHSKDGHLSDNDELPTTPNHSNHYNHDEKYMDKVMKRRHSEYTKAIPKQLLFSHGPGSVGGHDPDHEDHDKITVKISDFGLSKELELKEDDDEKEDKNNKKRKKSKHKKRKKDHLQAVNDRQFAVMATNCGTLYYVGLLTVSCPL